VIADIAGNYEKGVTGVQEVVLGPGSLGFECGDGFVVIAALDWI
jgi:hypothetical protein